MTWLARVCEDMRKTAFPQPIFAPGMLPLTITVEEATRYSGFSRNALYAAIAAGQLRVIRSGRLIRVPTRELERFVHDATASALDLADFADSGTRKASSAR